MTAFDELKLLYTQLFNTHDEILNYIEKDWDIEAIQKASHFEKISEQIKFAKNGISLNEDEKKEIEILDKKALDAITDISTKVTEKKLSIKKNLDTTKNKIKINSAYTAEAPKNGQILDEEE